MNNYKIAVILLIFAIFNLHCQSKKKQGGASLPTEVVETIEQRIEEGYTPSIVLALIDSSGVNYYNFGKTSIKGSEVNEHTIYEIGSISKAFTGIILAKQVLDKDAKLDDKINDYLPDSVHVPTSGDMEITLGNLTDHTSGFPRMPENFAPANINNPFADYTVVQMYEFISNYKPVREVGVEYEYSNLAQGLLGHILARKKNTTYEDLMVHTIAEPLEMNETRIVFTEKMKENLALGHRAGKVVDNWDMPTFAGAGGIRSSTSDLAKFIAANLGYENSTLDEAMNLSHRVRHHKAGEMSVAMGWHIKNGEDGDVIWHNGGTGGYRTFIGFVKETGKGVVLLTNSSTGADDIGFYLLDPGSELANLKFKSDAVELSESKLEKYVGLYEWGEKPDVRISITKEGTKLFGQVADMEKIEMYPENDTCFFVTVIIAEITFQVENGIVGGLTVFQEGQKIVAKKIK